MDQGVYTKPSLIIYLSLSIVIVLLHSHQILILHCLSLLILIIMSVAWCTTRTQQFGRELYPKHSRHRDRGSGVSLI